MKRFLFFTAALCGLLLSGCRGAESSELTAEETTAATTTTAEMTTVTSEIYARKTTTAPTLPAETTAGTTEAAEVTEPLATAQSNIVPQQQGGQGGEAHAEDPDPLYFNYRFAPDCFSMRLAGGNYQTIYYDLSEAVAHEIEALYTLADFNFDGSPDLVLPVQFANANTVDAIFFWNPDTLFYEEEPLLLVNPVPDAEREVINSLARNSASTWIMTTYAYQSGELTAIQTATADFSDNTLTVSSLTAATDDIVSQFTSAEALEEALLAQ